MKYCSYCGNELVDAAVVCPRCGRAVPIPLDHPDTPSVGLCILGFFIPLVGLILYLVFRENTPIRAGAIGKWALIGFCVNLVITFLPFML